MVSDSDKYPDLDVDTPPWLQPVPEREETSGGLTLKLATGLIVVLSVVALGVAIWLSQSGGSEGPIRHVRAPAGEIKTRPAEDARGGRVIPDQDKEVLAAAAGQPGAKTVQVAPLPEQPVSRLPKVSAPAETANTGEADDPAKPAPVITQPVTEDPAQQPADASPEPSLPGPSQTTQPPAEQRASVVTPEPIIANNNSFRVQLGAFGDQAAAEAAWRTARGRLAQLVRDLAPDYERLATSEGVLVRLRIGPLDNRAKADALCLAVREKNLPCFVVPPGS